MKSYDEREMDAINDNDKHLTALILWCKQRGREPLGLTEMLGCGSTVAQGIWEKYDKGWEGYAELKRTNSAALERVKVLEAQVEEMRGALTKARFSFDVMERNIRDSFWSSTAGIAGRQIDAALKGNQ